MVRRIFAMFADGGSPRAIARRLNAEGVPGPDGRPWQDTTIRGQAERGTGILNNELYVGRLVWNRCSYVKDPRTGKPAGPAQPASAVGAERGAGAAHRRRRALAGGEAAAGGAVLRGRPRRGRQRAQPGAPPPLPARGPAGLRRAAAAATRSWPRTATAAPRTAARAPAATTARSAARRSRAGCSRPQAAAAGARPVRAVRQAPTRRSATAWPKRLGAGRPLDGRLAAVERKIAAIIRAIEDGLYQPSMKARLAELEAEKAQGRGRARRPARRDAGGAAPKPAAAVPPEGRGARAAAGRPGAGAEAMAAIRALISRIVLTPAREGGVSADLRGRFGADPADLRGRRTQDARLAGGRSHAVPASQVSVVAGAATTLTCSSMRRSCVGGPGMQPSAIRGFCRRGLGALSFAS